MNIPKHLIHHDILGGNPANLDSIRSMALRAIMIRVITHEKTL